MLCVTLFHEDIQELMLLFFNHCQYVEIFLDGMAFVDVAQLEAYQPGSRASSLLMRGYYEQVTEQGVELRLIQLSMGRMMTKLIGQRWNEREQDAPPVLRQIRSVLNRSYRRPQSFFLSIAFYTVLSSFPQVFLLGKALSQPILYNVPVFFVLLLPALAVGILFLFVFHGLLHLLRINRYIYLLPGTPKTTRSYGRKEVGATLLLAIAFTILLYALAFAAERWFSMLLR